MNVRCRSALRASAGFCFPCAGIALHPTDPRPSGTRTTIFPQMAKQIEMPKLADTMTEGTVVRWLIKEGDKVAEGQEIAEIETDKATMGYESLDAGTVYKLLVAAGQK